MQYSYTVSMRWKKKSAKARITELRASRRDIVKAFEIERRRIERDLHDGAQQHLVAANMAIGEAQLLLDAYSAELPAQLADLPHVLARAHTAGDEGLRALRATVNQIYPQVLSNIGLEAAVRSAADASPVNVRVVTPHPLPEIPEGVAATAYFFAAECLTNITKYAPYASATVLLAADAVLHISVVDDGPGGAAVTPGHGLAGLRERLVAFGGELQCDSPLGGPTTVSASIPLLLIEGESGIGV